MTNAEIDTLTGRELDAAVAGHVFSLDLHPEKWPTHEDNAVDGRTPIGMVLFNRVPESEGDGSDFVHFIPATGIFQNERPVLIPAYSSDIAAAFSVVDAMVARRCMIDMIRFPQRVNGRPAYWHVCFRPGRDSGWGEARDAALPVAICRAALKAVIAPAREEAAIAAERDTPSGTMLGEVAHETLAEREPVL